MKAEKGSKRYNRIRNCIFISGLSVFAQLYLFQPMLSTLCVDFQILPATSSLSVSMATIGMAVGLFVFAFKADSIPREKLMGFTLITSSILTIMTAFAWSFPSLLVLTFLKGVVLSGVSAVALAYISEEVSVSVIGLAISLYLSGNTIGGMSGRVLSTLISGWAGWKITVVSIGFICLILGLIFVRKIPRSHFFTPVHTPIGEKLQHMKMYLQKPLFLGMYFIAMFAMGVFVSVYNYLSFILEYRFGLPHYIVAMIFMMYTLGVAGSIVIGKLSDKYSPSILLMGSITLMIMGLMLLSVMNLAIIILGLGIATFAFFSVHTMASRIVSTNARQAKSSATSLYWLFYYIGSSAIGYLSGLVLSLKGWEVFVWILVSLIALAFIISITTMGRFTRAKLYIGVKHKFLRLN